MIEALALALGFVVGAALRRWIAVPVASGIAGALALLLHTDTNRAFLVALLAVLAGAAAGAAVVGLRERQAARRD